MRLRRQVAAPIAFGLLVALATVLTAAPGSIAQPALLPAADDWATAPSWRYGGTFAANAGATRLAPQDEILVLDTFSGAPAYSVTGGLPRTVMGDPFDAADPGAPLDIIRVQVYLASTTARTYANGLCVRVRFWEQHDPLTSPVFSQPVGEEIEVRFPGPVSLAADTYYVFSFPVEPAASLADLTGNGFVVNFQGDNGSGCADSDSLTSLLRFVPEPAEAPIAVGAIPLTPPHLGFYRNASGRADLNFDPADLRYVVGTNSNAVAIQLYAAAPGPTHTYYLPLLLRS